MPDSSDTKKLRMPRNDLARQIIRIVLVVIGTLILAFGTAIFLTKLNIVSGGIGGIGIIVQNYFPNFEVIDITAFILTWILWVIGLIFVGKDFALRTLVSSIVYPFALALFLRVGVFQDLAETVAGDGSTGNLLLCAVFGGVFVGAGVALTFLGGGSSGGVDILCFIIEKYTGLRQSISSFIIDGVIIILGMTLIPDNFVNALCGIIAAFLCALMIEFMYNSNQNAYQADIISVHNDEISRYIQDELGRGVTIIEAKGGYHGDDRPILRVVFDRSQLNKLRDYVAKVDPNAFMTITTTSAVYGEGFKVIKESNRSKRHKESSEVKVEENSEDIKENHEE